MGFGGALEQQFFRGPFRLTLFFAHKLVFNIIFSVGDFLSFPQTVLRILYADGKMNALRWWKNTELIENLYSLPKTTLVIDLLAQCAKDHDYGWRSPWAIAPNFV